MAATQENRMTTRISTARVRNTTFWRIGMVSIIGLQARRSLSRPTAATRIDSSMLNV